MKRIMVPLAIVAAGLFLGWCGGNLWADRVRETEPIGFDIGTRLTYQTRGVVAGAVGGIIAAMLSVCVSRVKRNGNGSQNQGVQEHE